MFQEIIENNPVIAAIKDMEGLEKCIQSDIQVVFVLFGDICIIPDIVKRLKDANKVTLVHTDLITGLSSKEICVNFLKKYTKADGIISTKQSMIKQAKELGMYAVFRCFILDSMAVTSLKKQSFLNSKPDLIEVMPGIIPKVIKELAKVLNVPLIAGGLVSEKEEVMEALNAGAIAVSSSNQKVWFM